PRRLDKGRSSVVRRAPDRQCDLTASLQTRWRLRSFDRRRGKPCLSSRQLFLFRVAQSWPSLSGRAIQSRNSRSLGASLCTCQSWLSRQHGIHVTSASDNRPRVSGSSELFWIRNLIFSAVGLSARRVPDLTH